MESAMESALAPGFRRLPSEYQDVLAQAQEYHDIYIKPLEQLTGGRTGALLYLVSVEHRGSGTVDHLILKLDRPGQRHDPPDEHERHQAALEQAPRDFAEQHMASLAFDPIVSDGTLAIFYSIAGGSLQRFRPLSSYKRRIELEQTFTAISRDLLEAWNANRAEVGRPVHPQAILERWLGHRIRPGEGRIHAFLEQDCGVSPETPGLIVEGRTVPNPLVYARYRECWGSAICINGAVGFVHGDLNTNNVLAQFSRGGSELEGYYLIDFAEFKEEQYLLYDHLYLELSYLMGQVSRVSHPQWVSLVTTLAEGDCDPDVAGVTANLEGPCLVVASGRREFDRWVREHYPTLHDNFWGLFRLAAVAVGMNFCSKSGLSKEERIAGLIYAAAHLHGYFERFGLPRPEEARQLTLAGAEELPEVASEWEPFLEACHEFDRDRTYILVVGSQPGPLGLLFSPIGRAGWTLILDFDPDTKVDGLYKMIAEEIQRTRSLHLLTCEDRPSLNPALATYWHAARGLSGRSGTFPTDDSWRAWNRKYSTPLKRLLIDLARSSAEEPATMVIVWDDPEYVRKICELVDEAFGDRVDFVFAVPNPQPLRSIIRTYGGRTCSLRLDQIAAGLRNLFATVPRHERQEVLLPSIDNEVTALEMKDVTWLEEELTLVHLGLGAREEEGRELGRDFLRGRRISWFELALHRDMEREKTRQLIARLEQDLDARSVTRINLYHQPGGGGTTVALRAAWNLHKSYPTILLRRVSDETVGRLRLIFSQTSQPVLAVVEAADVPLDTLDPLYSQVRSEGLPVVFLMVSRRFQSVPEPGRVFYLRELLDGEEANRFAHAYVQEVPSKRSELIALAQDESQLKFRVPFYFGLTAFETEFVRLDSYVRARLEGMTDIEQKIMCYLALAYRYAQKALPSQLFGPIIGVDRARPVRLKQTLRGPRLDLLVYEKEYERESGWRPAHYLIACEICEQILAGEAMAPQTWRQNLSAWAIRMIEDLVALRASEPSELVIDLLRRFFVLRDSQEVLGTETTRPTFAQLIEDIPSREGQLLVLQRLVNNFPEEAHFWAHLGRYLSYQHEHEKALESVNEAIARSDGKDYVLYHIKGMVLRTWAYNLIKEAGAQFRAAGQVDEGTLCTIDDLLKQAEDEFGKARDLAPDNDHCYVSHIQLLVRRIEFAFTISGKASYEEFLASQEALRFQEMVERAENLLEDVKRLREGEPSSKYVESCANNLTEFYGDYSQILKSWTDFLGRLDIHKPPVRRRLVRVYLARRNRSWDHLRPGELNSILHLMQQNILEEPGKDRNVRLWFQAARRIPSIDLDEAIERLTYWHSRSESLDALYYLYALQTLKAVDGSALAKVQVERLAEECKRKARPLRNRTYCFDWLGKGSGLARFVNRAKLGEWDTETNFFEDTSLLTLVPGTIASIKRPQAGFIELRCGLRAFFVPGQRHRPSFIKGRDENKDVVFFLGFSYDGLRAWSVDLA